MLLPVVAVAYSIMHPVVGVVLWGYWFLWYWGIEGKHMKSLVIVLVKVIDILVFCD